VGLISAAADGISLTIPMTAIYGIAAALIVAVATPVFARLKPLVWAHFQAVNRLRRAERSVDDNSPGIWLTPSIKIEPPDDYERKIKTSKPIIVVANLKGGVGKTTTVANLIGHFGLKKKLRVLALDMDFQGSLSAVVLSQSDYDDSLEKQADRTPSKAAQLIAGKDAQWVLDTSVAVNGVETARCIPSYYTLSTMENRLMVEWTIGKRKDDIRYALASVLHERKIQDRFDVILIDAPPRLTTACVQALCAATHVLVPTVLDGLSAEASGGFVDQIVTNQSLWPHLELLGVVGNMTNQVTARQDGQPKDGSLGDYEADARQSVVDTVGTALEAASVNLRRAQIEPVFPTETFIPQKSELGRDAGNKIAYRVTGGSSPVQDISRAFDRLGDEIDRRIAASKKS
jgi:cellulose biosynthesis protein BcsQ